MTLTLLGAVVTALAGIWAYLTQREADRKHQILSERRAIYLEYAGIMAGHMFMRVNIDSVMHFERRDALNKVGGKLSIVATQSIVDAHVALVKYLSEKEASAEDGNVTVYFDEHAQELLNCVLSEMRSDALPKSVRVSRN